MSPRKKPEAREVATRVTTVAFPEALFVALRTLAAERRTTLRALVVEACEAHLAAPRSRRRLS